MNAAPTLPLPVRRIQNWRQTKMAEDLERELEIRNADLQSRGFVSNVIHPALRAAEDRLTELSVSAMATGRITPGAARSTLTVILDEDRPPETLMFEAWLGSTEPRIRWTRGQHSSGGLARFDPEAVDAIVTDFLNDVLRRNQPPRRGAVEES